MSVVDSSSPLRFSVSSDLELELAVEGKATPRPTMLSGAVAATACSPSSSGFEALSLDMAYRRMQAVLAVHAAKTCRVSLSSCEAKGNSRYPTLHFCEARHEAEPV